MKKIKNVLLVLISVLLLSGCVKMHTNITINKDKSMKYEFEYLISDALKNEATSENETATENEIATATETEETNEIEMSESMDLDDMKKTMAEKGFTVTDVSRDGYSGFKIEKIYKTIDDVSDEKEIDTTVNDLLDKDTVEKFFRVEKGFFKDTYYYLSSEAFKTDMGEDNTEPAIDESNIEENTAVEAAEDDVLTTGTEEETTTTGDLSGLDDMMSLMGEMEFKFSVTLPYKAISHNATEVSKDGKTLTWNMGAVVKDRKVEFSFAVIKFLPILLIGGGALLLIGIVVAVILILKKKKSGEETLIHSDYDSNVVTEEDINKTPEQEEFENKIDAAIEEADKQDEVKEKLSVPEEPSIPLAKETDVIENNYTENRFIEKEEEEKKKSEIKAAPITEIPEDAGEEKE